MKKILFISMSCLLMLACQKTDENRKEKAQAAQDARAKAANKAKEDSKSKKEKKDEKANTESALVNTADVVYTLAGGKSTMRIKSSTANPCMIFDTKFADGQYSMNFAFADKDSSFNAVTKANQPLLKELLLAAVESAEKSKATIDGMNSFVVGDGKLNLKVKGEEFTSAKCEISAKPRLYKTDLDFPGYEIEMTCSDVQQKGSSDAQKTIADGLIKITAYCSFGAQK